MHVIATLYKVFFSHQSVSAFTLESGELGTVTKGSLNTSETPVAGVEKISQLRALERRHGYL